MSYRVNRVHELVEGLEADGMSGLLRVVGRMIDPDGPSAECIKATDDAMDSAVGNEQYWDAALGMAACFRDELLAPEPQEPEPGEPEPDRGENLGDLVLAALLAHLRRLSKT